MRKISIFGMMLLAATSMMFMACDDGDSSSDSSSSKTYKVGDVGPGGGIIFYDCDADNDSTNEGKGKDNLSSSVDGWRYLEAATENVTVDGETSFPYGYHRYHEQGTGDLKNFAMSGLNDGLGYGKANSEKLVVNLGSSNEGLALIEEDTTSQVRGMFAAKAATLYNGGGKSDWYMPSLDEMLKMKEADLSNLPIADNAGFWVSAADLSTYAYIAPTSGSGNCGTAEKSSSHHVRPIRCFK